MRHTSRFVQVLAGLILAAALVLGPLSLVIIGSGTGTRFVTGLLMAVLPVPFYLAFALWIDRFEPEPAWLLIVVFLWGAGIAAFISLVVNGVFEEVLSAALDATSASMVTTLFSAPLIEELSKGMALVLLFLFVRGHFDNVTDGIVYAFMVGLGFAMTENVQYYGQSLAAADGPAGTFVLRGIMSPFAHPLFTSMTGIGLGLARESPRRWVRWIAPPGGLATAMLFHGLWNLSASAGLAFLVIYALIMVPTFLAVMVVALFSLAREARIIRTYLGSLVAEGVVSDEDIRVLSSVPARIGASTRALLEHGFRTWRARRRFHALATELAFHSWHMNLDPSEDRDGQYSELRTAVCDSRARLPQRLS